MIAVSPALQALLRAGQFVMADLYAFTLASGAVVRYTSFDRDLPVGADVFQALGPVLRRGPIRQSTGVEVDALDVTVAPGPGHLIQGQPWLQAAHAGALDGARLLLQRAFLSDPWAAAPMGVMYRFTGRVSVKSASRTECRLVVRSDLDLLDIPMPRNLYQPGCASALFDSACGLSRAAWQVSATVASGARGGVTASLAQPAGWADGGTVTFTSGACAGLTRTVRSHTLAGGVSTLNFIQPLPVAPAAGDAFTCCPGCDKSWGTCKTKFSNGARYRGQPYIPIPETAL